MANTPNPIIKASDWLKGWCSCDLNESLMMIGPAMYLIIITGSEQGGNECSNGGTSPV